MDVPESGRGQISCHAIPESNEPWPLPEGRQFRDGRVTGYVEARSLRLRIVQTAKKSPASYTLFDFLCHSIYNSFMAPRTGRPRTGIKPVFRARVDPAVADTARAAARASGKGIGVWLEAAIREKAERERQSGRP